jgi:hypothetical protein
MKIRILLMMVCALALTSNVFAQKNNNGKGGTAIPATTVTFDGGRCTATFVRSASGIINETNRVCQGDDPFAGAKLQFRPINGTPNPSCDPDGLLVAPFTFSTTEASLVPFFGSQTYNVCVYLEQPTQSGTIDVTTSSESGDSSFGTNVILPATGSYSVCVSGTYSLGDNIIGDAAYVSDGGGAFMKGLARYPELGPNIGNVKVDGNFLFSGLAYNENHNYCTTITGTKGQSVNLSIYDTFAQNNSGSLSYTVKFLGY